MLLTAKNVGKTLKKGTSGRRGSHNRVGVVLGGVRDLEGSVGVDLMRFEVGLNCY